MEMGRQYTVITARMRKELIDYVNECFTHHSSDVQLVGGVSHDGTYWSQAITYVNSGDGLPDLFKEWNK